MLASYGGSFEGAAIPSEYHAVVLYALHKFFEMPAVQDEGGTFASASPEDRASAVAAYLCGANGFVSAAPPSPNHRSRQRRVLLTGCFDLLHAGHYNALRQAKMCFPGDEVILVAGVHGDAAILEAKGAPTVCTNEERVEMVRACRWVDEVVGDLPYEVPVSLLDRLNCEVAVHGDDLPRVTDGTGLFDELIAAKRLHIVKRTEGTSTTVLIGRLLSMSKEHLQKSEDQAMPAGCLVSEETSKGLATPEQAKKVGSDAPLWMLLPTMSRLAVFFAGRKCRLPEAKTVVYCPGEWDLFHLGHLRFLEQARTLGDFLLVGCYDDPTIHKKKGRNYPLQTVHERALNVLACRHVDDVVLAAPWCVTQDLLTSLNVSIVVTGETNIYAKAPEPGYVDPLGLGDPFDVPRSTGILHTIPSVSGLTMDILADRVLTHAMEYTMRQYKKEKVEQDYRETKTFVAET
eukprot:gnl/TRDRNA2_/TRDRNA2_45043_c0_seq1.p1 gnl/TRDRNA2_/TRDRNA2_45043_c0~~gnl/TRDRNA2_/TRDRNA2_45043_c0_seq1.p1  ORF type:complete len:459 (-),score=81.54 gnl/TRDRNA2_/TRDRNA2_45043_c0_seq1:94-1470(-)